MKLKMYISPCSIASTVEPTAIVCATTPTFPTTPPGEYPGVDEEP